MTGSCSQEFEDSLLQNRGLNVTAEYAEDVYVISCRNANRLIQSCAIKDTDLVLQLYIYIYSNS